LAERLRLRHEIAELSRTPDREALNVPLAGHPGETKPSAEFQARGRRFDKPHGMGGFRETGEVRQDADLLFARRAPILLLERPAPPVPASRIATAARIYPHLH